MDFGEWVENLIIAVLFTAGWYALGFVLFCTIGEMCK